MDNVKSLYYSIHIRKQLDIYLRGIYAYSASCIIEDFRDFEIN